MPFLSICGGVTRLLISHWTTARQPHGRRHRANTPIRDCAQPPGLPQSWPNTTARASFGSRTCIARTRRRSGSILCVLPGTWIHGCRERCAEGSSFSHPRGERGHAWKSMEGISKSSTRRNPAEGRAHAQSALAGGRETVNRMAQLACAVPFWKAVVTGPYAPKMWPTKINSGIS